MPRIEPLPGHEGDVVPGGYAIVREYHQRELSRLNSLQDVVYSYLKKKEGPVHRAWLRRMQAREPVLIPAWALTDFDDGAEHLGDWLRRTDDVIIWPDDRVTPALKRQPDEAYLDPCVWRSSWELAGHAPRWPLD